MSESLTLDVLKQAVAGRAAALRCVTRYQPTGGPGDKVFPPTYEGGKYAVEMRHIDGKEVGCVLLNSVQSEANYMELALRDAWEEMLNGKRRLVLPILRVTFKFELKGVPKEIHVTSLDAPHRIADAIFRDSLLEEGGRKILFRKSSKGLLLDIADIRNATGLFGLCPTALLFGLWDSAGPRGGLGAKFQRAIVSEIVGIDAQPGVTTGGKVDHLNILKDAGPLYERAAKADGAPHWTLDEAKAAIDKDNHRKKIGKKGEGKPSDANLGGVTPDFAYAKNNRGDNIRESDGSLRIKGGFTIREAAQTTVLSLTALRRLRFPLKDKTEDQQAAANRAARTTLAALGLCAATLAREQGADLRSRCQLFPNGPFVWQLLDTPGETPKPFDLSAEEAVNLLNAAVGEAGNVGLPWQNEVIELTPSDDLLALVRRSQEIAAETGEGE